MLRKLVPNQRVRSIYDIDLKSLYDAGIRGIITDLDNTLVRTREPHADEKLSAWLVGLQSAGFKVVIVSNNNRERVAGFSVPLSIPFVHAARKPLSVGFRKSLRLLGLAPEHTAVIGDQILTDVYGGNRLGMHTILVKPVSFEGEKMVTRLFNRKIEKIAIRQMRKRGLFPREDKK